MAILIVVLVLALSLSVSAQAYDATQGIPDAILSKFNCMHLKSDSCSIFAPFCAENSTGKCSKVKQVRPTFAIAASTRQEEAGACTGNECVTLNFGNILEHSIPLNLTCTGTTASANEFTVKYQGNLLTCGSKFLVPKGVNSIQLDVSPVNDDVCDPQTATSEKVKLNIDCTKSQALYCLAGAKPSHTVTLNDTNDCRPTGTFQLNPTPPQGGFRWSVTGTTGNCKLGLNWVRFTSATQYTYQSRVILVPAQGVRTDAQINTDSGNPSTFTPSTPTYPYNANVYTNLTCPGPWGSSIFFPDPRTMSNSELGG